MTRERESPTNIREERHRIVKGKGYPSYQEQRELQVLNEARPRIATASRRGGRDDGAAEGRRRNSDGFILDVETLAGSLMQDSNSKSAKAATANYANKQPLFPNTESPTCK